MTAAFLPDPAEREQLLNLAARLEGAAPDAVLYLHLPGQDTPAALSPVLAGLLRQSVRELGEGHAVTLLPTKTELSTFEAARLLGVSRPFLITNLLDTGKIPFRRVGSHRRIALPDLAAYQAEQERGRKILDELTALEQELGLY